MIQVTYKWVKFIQPFTETCKKLYEEAYYEKIKKALKPDGVICSLGIHTGITVSYYYYITLLADCMLTDAEFMKIFTQTIRKQFPVVRYAFGVYTPVYIGGQCGFLVASKDKVKTSSLTK